MMLVFRCYVTLIQSPFTHRLEMDAFPENLLSILYSLPQVSAAALYSLFHQVFFLLLIFLHPAADESSDSPFGDAGPFLIVVPSLFEIFPQPPYSGKPKDMYSNNSSS